MSIVKIWLVLLIGIEAGAERIRPAEDSSKEQLTERIRPVDIRQQEAKCGCKCKSRPSEMAKLATSLSDIVSAVQAQERKREEAVQLHMR